MTDRHLTRQSLILRAQQGSEEAWETFSDVYRRYLYVVVRRMNIPHHDALDIVQTVMLKVWKSLPDVKLGDGQPRFRTWLCTITRNTVLNFIRDKKRLTEREQTLQNENGADYLNSIRLPEIEAIAEREWATFVSNLAFDRIKPHFTGSALAVFEAHLAGEPVAVTAERLGISEQSVYPLRSRVKSRLMQEVKKIIAELEG